MIFNVDLAVPAYIWVSRFCSVCHCMYAYTVILRRMTRSPEEQCCQLHMVHKMPLLAGSDAFQLGRLGKSEFLQTPVRLETEEANEKAYGNGKPVKRGTREGEVDERFLKSGRCRHERVRSRKLIEEPISSDGREGV